MQDFNKGCRVCLQVQAKMKDIKSCGSETVEKLSTILGERFNVDGGPNKICFECMSKVWDFDIFRTTFCANYKSYNAFKQKQNLINNFEGK